MEAKSIIKNDIELINVPYSQGKRWCVIIVQRDGKIEPKFPFNSEEEAKSLLQISNNVGRKR